MHRSLDCHSVVIVGGRTGAAVIMRSMMITERTLVGYIEAHARELLVVAELEFHETGAVHPVLQEVLREVRDDYNDALETDNGDGGDEEVPDGDMALFARLKAVVDVAPKKEESRSHFPRKERRSLKMGDTQNGGLAGFRVKR